MVLGDVGRRDKYRCPAYERKLCGRYRSGSRYNDIRRSLSQLHIINILKYFELRAFVKLFFFDHRREFFPTDMTHRMCLTYTLFVTVDIHGVKHKGIDLIRSKASATRKDVYFIVLYTEFASCFSFFKAVRFHGVSRQNQFSPNRLIKILFTAFE